MATASLSQTSRESFEAALEKVLPQERVLQGALTAAPLLLTVLAVSIPQISASNGPLAPQQLAGIGALGAIHLVLAMSSWLIAPVIERMFFTKKALEKAAQRTLPTTGLYPDGLVGKSLQQLRLARIVRLGLYEFPALLGAIVLFLAATNGLLQQYPWLWINVASGMALLARGITSWPSKERLMAEFDEWIARKA